MKKLVLAIAFLLFGITAEAEHRGRVFVDVHADGTFGKGDRPLQGIMVSDGLNVTVTDKNGCFVLPGHDRAHFIFLTTPSGYRTTKNHYIPIQKEGQTYDFALQPFKGRIGKNGEHRFIHIADTEIFNTTDHGDWADNIRDYAAHEQAAFIIHTGDICYEKGLKEHIKLMNSGNMNCPMYYCIGNHDLVKGRYGEELYESLYGPVYYSFDAGHIHYIVTPMAGGDYRSRYTAADVYKWMKNDLRHVKKGTPVIVFNHDLLTTGHHFVFKGGEEGSIDLNAHNLKAWIYGHWHNHFLRRQGDVLSISTATPDKGGIDHSTSAYRVIDINGKGELHTQLRYTYIDHHLCIAAPADTIRQGNVPVTVNAYTSGAETKEIRITCLSEGKPLNKSRLLPRATDWSWCGTAYIPGYCAGHPVTLCAEALFSDGKKAVTERTFFCAENTEEEGKGPALRPETNCDNLLGNAAHSAAQASGPLPPLHLVWSNNVGANLYMCSPLVHDGRVYVASVDEELEGTAHLYALNATDGSRIWEYRVRNSVKNSIAISGHILFAQDAEGWLYAVDIRTGKLQWEKKLPNDGLPAIVEGLATHDGIVYAGTGKALGAYRAENGEPLWTNSDWPQNQGTTNTPTLTENGVLVMGTQWGALYGNDARTGKMLWHKSDHGLRFRSSTPAACGGQIYVLSDQALFIMDALTERILLRKDLPFSVDGTSTPLLTDHHIVFGTATEGIVALDRETLEMKWQTRVGEALVYTVPYKRKPSAAIETSPVWAGNMVYATTSGGTLYALRLSDGAVTWKHEMGAPIFSTPALSGNMLFVTDFGGNIYAFTSDAEKE